jgi:hypothetical protein
MDWIHIVVAGTAAILTLIFGGQALSQQSTMKFPWLIALCVAGLVFVSLYNLNDAWMKVILLPYAALGIAMLGFILLSAWQKWGKRRNREDDDRFNKE